MYWLNFSSSRRNKKDGSNEEWKKRKERKELTGSNAKKNEDSKVMKKVETGRK